MPIPLLTYPPKSQNQRVVGYEVPNEEQPRVYSIDSLPSTVEMDALIQAAYRQIYHEQQMIASNRQLSLESQLRVRQITVKQFIRGLAISDSFRRLNFDSNNNYRFAQICIQRILGREVYNEQEKIAWSIVIATKGLAGFIDDLLNTDEYITNFSDHTVPYQRRRILPQRAKGDLPFERMARYDEYHLAKLPKPSLGRRGPGAARLDYVRWDWQRTPSKSLTQIGGALAIGGAAFIGLLFFAILFGF